jgi:hypothetical protein
LAVQQSPAQLLPQLIDPLRHPGPLHWRLSRARDTHTSSQLPSQQNASNRQTASQQAESLQDGVPLTWQHSPVPKAPQVGTVHEAGVCFAAVTQPLSQETWQQ